MTRKRVCSGRPEESCIEYVVYTKGSIETVVIRAKDLKNYEFSVAVVERTVRLLGLNIL